ncbi:MAG: arylamine N-acetyltransferase [Bryobacterales bacterium]|nr:arylamine N-acetyltransferase [Bryobacterales bacterium]
MTEIVSSGIPAGLRDRILRRLGLNNTPPTTSEGLRLVYNAWSRRVPFDNVRKLLALRTGSPLPGRDATDFFGAWLETGAGGTCWPGSNALYELLCALGFRARLATGSMHDMGVRNHGTVIVTLDSAEFLADSSFLTCEPVPLADSLYTYADGVTAVEVEPDSASHVVWTRGPHQSTFLPCRIFPESISPEAALANYENSRRQSPFNQRLYALRGLPGRMILLRGNTRYERTRAGVFTRDLTPEQLRHALHADIGLSRSLIDAWSECGALAASFEPPSGPAPPPPGNVPPSQRLEIHLPMGVRFAGL